MRDHPHHEDLGLDPEADRTDDLRPNKTTAPVDLGVDAPSGDRCEPTNHEEGSSPMTVAADTAARQRHLRRALGHIMQAVAYTEGMAGHPGADLGALYGQRAELRHIADQLDDMIGTADG